MINGVSELELAEYNHEMMEFCDLHNLNEERAVYERDMWHFLFRAAYLRQRLPLVAFWPFDGDGREVVAPIRARPNTHPMSVTNARARKCLGEFIRKGRSFHSGRGGMLWIIEEWASVAGRTVIVTEQRHLGKIEGYSVELVS